MTHDLEPDSDPGAEPIAIVGMAARVPGAGDLRRFWRNLVDGVESVKPATREELLARGADPATLDDPSWVNATTVVEGFDEFDADLFGMTSREAEITDPQHRVFLEACHSALTDGGYDPARYRGAIGVYGGTGRTGYLVENLLRNERVMASQHGGIGMSTGNQPSYLTTAVSYKLNLRGPSLAIHTACSTSLVAVHLACEALRNGECDMALAGGVNLEMPHGIGYMGVEGFTSPDGHVRAFDAGANGTVWSSGAGVVLVKRLSQALEDGDHIRAVVLGNAINNDGATKVGFSAPSVAGQTEAIAQAVGMAGVDPRTIGYVEAHGTGTALGDPIEINSLSTVYGHGVPDTGWCAIGSVKSNIGHLSQAAGVVALIKTVLAMEHGLIPPTINYAEPNPGIDFPRSPFYPARTVTKWEAADTPRRAGVSSFGVGGTNAHLVLEEAPPPRRQRRPHPAHLLRVSAKTPETLATAVEHLADRLAGDVDLDLADVAHTLAAGRTEYPHRAVVVARDTEDAVDGLRDPRRLLAARADEPQVAFLFSGQGSQYAGMGAELYRSEPVFAAAVDECCELSGIAGLKDLIFDRGGDTKLRETRYTQPALFVVEYALAVLWRSWGVRPGAMIGHSVGEYVAATVAGVFTPADAVRLVVRRGELMQAMPAGAMLAVQLDEEAVAKRLPAGLAIAGVNGPGTCVVAGPSGAVADFAALLKASDVQCRELVTSHAFHSPMMDPILAEFTEAVAAVPRSAPALPFLSNLTGGWITGAQATDPGYWAAHLRRAVRFGDCVRTLFAGGERWALVECGPGHQLAGLARAAVPKGLPAPRPSLPGRTDREGDVETLYAAAGLLWAHGVPVESTSGYRVPLPGYPYARKRYWIDPDPKGTLAEPERPSGPLPLDEWFAVPSWRQAGPDLRREPFTDCLAFVEDDVLPGLLRDAGVAVTEVRPGERFAAVAGGFTVRPGVREDYDELVAALAHRPERVVHAWALGGTETGMAAQDRGFFSVLNLVQAWGEPVRIDVLSTGTADVTGTDLTRPEHATLAGIARVVPLEVPGAVVRRIDVETVSAEVVAELFHPADAPAEVAVRRGRRWVLEHTQLAVPEAAPVLRAGGRYLITGGTGGIGVTLAEDFALRVRAKLILLTRGGLPPREEWDAHLAAHGGTDRAGRAVLAVRRMEAAGAVVHVVAADVTDPARLREVRELAEREFGGLDGIVHAAGLPGGGVAEVKERPAAEAVLAPKIGGTLALAEAFADLPLDFVALCSSVTAVSGDFGQVDYCAANNFLDAYARGDHGWRARVVSHNWGGWDEVGMAAEVAAPSAIRSTRTKADGPVAHPVLSTRTGGSCHGLVSAAGHWLLDEHRIAGVPVVPGTGHLESVRAAVEAALPRPGDGHVVELQDVVFLEPFSVPEGTVAEYRVAFDGDGFAVTSRAAGVTKVHVRGSAGWVPAPTTSTVDLDAVRGRTRVLDDGNAFGTGRTSMVTFGPRWAALRTHHVGEHEELASLVAPEAAAGDTGWALHPALLDVATAFGRGRGSGTYLPMSYGRVVVHAPLPASFHSHLRYRDSGGDQVVSADLTLCADDGRVLVEIEDFVLRQVDEGAVSGGLAAVAPRSTVDSAGIRPVDGAEAFLRALTPGLGGQVVISTRPVRDLFARRVTAERLEETEEAAEPAEAPVQDGYLAPRTDLEAEIARQWAEVLGVERVGVDDDFFALGGNSLVAIQLIAQVRKTTGARLAMKTLFESSTVAALAERIEELRGAELSRESSAPAAAEPAATTIPKLER
ncbi:beta-ketoacyl synthase N-terminal-like domain-containing protein [Amycolatopsis sp. A133]|uniref:type I polyketide synthase n=1 Tax=Amycolatopsis sp. A133 TaxID=3064472 RepID=UPI0027F20588|nr:polyketide synthase [Amycolatopsis sp. A133]MDQ7802935.1 beta-ketoacyl synthase N-terminal-like domain-containing protein [Amycolatopsis sp. A133]